MDTWDWGKAIPWLITGGAGMLGRIMFHAVQVQKGARKPFSWVLIWDLPVAVSMGWIAYGLAAWAKIPWESTVSFSLVVSYLGPYGVDTLFAKWANWKFGGKNGSSTE